MSIHNNFNDDGDNNNNDNDDEHSMYYLSTNMIIIKYNIYKYCSNTMTILWPKANYVTYFFCFHPNVISLLSWWNKVICTNIRGNASRYKVKHIFWVTLKMLSRKDICESLMITHSKALVHKPIMISSDKLFYI